MVELSKKDRKELMMLQIASEQNSKIRPVSPESNEEKYDRTVLGWIFLIPLIARILVGISWADYWQIIMDVTFTMLFIVGLCILFYKGRRT